MRSLLTRTAALICASVGLVDPRPLHAQRAEVDFEAAVFAPKQYVAYRATPGMAIDGKDASPRLKVDALAR